MAMRKHNGSLPSGGDGGDGSTLHLDAERRQRYLEGVKRALRRRPSCQRIAPSPDRQGRAWGPAGRLGRPGLTQRHYNGATMRRHLFAAAVLLVSSRPRQDRRLPANAPAQPGVDPTPAAR
jgi:hypothetical protein